MRARETTAGAPFEAVSAAFPAAERPWLAGYPADIDWAAEIPVAPLNRLLDDAVARFPERPCIDFLDRKFTYAEIGGLVDRAAKGLAELGVRPGAKVGLFLPNCPYFVVFYYAVLKAGGTVVNYNPLYAEREVVRQIEDSDTEIMVTLDLAVLYDKLAAAAGQTRLRRIVVCRMADILPFPRNWLFPLAMYRQIAAPRRADRWIDFRDLVANDGVFSAVPVDPVQAIALLQYTGGTTGSPKAAMLTHANVYANAVQSAMWFTGAAAGQERMLGVLPLFHAFAMTAVMNWSLRLGAEMILMPRFHLARLLRAIDRKRPTTMVGVPTLFAAIGNDPKLGRYDLSSLRFCLSGGAPLPAELRDRFERLTGCRLVEGYGLSECSPVAACNPLEGGGKPGAVGLPYPRTTIEVLSPEPPHRPLPVGEHGEICIAGPQVMAGYWKRPEETAATIIDGRLHTGDVGYLDAEGYLFVTDRLKEMINVGGFKVYPRMVEEAIYLHPAVAECAVIGLPDPYRGETVKAFVAPQAGKTLTEAELIGFLADKLSPIEMPRQIEFRAELPKTAIGKIEKKALRAEETARRQAATQGSAEP